MLKIAAVFMTTSAIAGMLISGPGIAMHPTASSAQLTTVKVKTITIRMPAGAKEGPSMSGRFLALSDV